MTSGPGFAQLPDGGRLAYTVHGGRHGGPPLLLVRPLGGTSRLWGRFRDRLAEDHRVIAYDYRGTGLSSSARVRSTRGLATEALALLEHLDVRAFHLFGLSLGGMVATWIAAQAGSRVRSVCLASAPVCGLDLSTGRLQRELSLASCFFRHEEDVDVAIVHRVLSTRFRAEFPDEVAHIERIVRSEPIARVMLAKLAIAAIGHDGRSAARTIARPTLVLRGERDPLLTPETARELAHAIAPATFETIANAGHDVTLEAPEASAARVSAHVRSAD